MHICQSLAVRELIKHQNTLLYCFEALSKNIYALRIIIVEHDYVILHLCISQGNDFSSATLAV